MRHSTAFCRSELKNKLLLPTGNKQRKGQRIAFLGIAMSCQEKEFYIIRTQDQHWWTVLETMLQNGTTNKIGNDITQTKQLKIGVKFQY